MIRISITAAAFDAIAATMPFGSVSYENGVSERGERYVWLAPNVVNRLKAMRRPGDRILQLYTWRNYVVLPMPVCAPRGGW